MSYHHISIAERGKIEVLHKLGSSSREIGKLINRHHSSVAREIKRLSCRTIYEAGQAQDDYHLKRKNSKSKGKFTDEIGKIIVEKLRSTWSPEQISNTVVKGKASFKTIYNWLYSPKFKGISHAVLRRKGRKRSCKNLAFFAKGESIRKRPKEVYNRKTFGHWELDTVVSGRGNSSCFATFIERKTRFYVAIKMADKTASSMEKAIKHLYSMLPKKAFVTATTDRGGEFACFDNIKRDLGLTLYFADPYCPHQRGSNEYGNGLLREFFPKAFDLSKVSVDQLNDSLLLINSRPKKCLNWLSPLFSFLHELSHLD